MPRNWAVTNGSSTTVTCRLAGLVAPSRRVARSAPSPAAFAEVEVGRARARPRSRSRSGSRRRRRPACVTDDVAAGLPPGGADAGAGGHRRLAQRVGVVGSLDPRRGGSRPERQPLELHGQRDLVLGGEAGQVVAPQVELGDGARRRARPGRPTRRACRRRRCRGPRPAPRPATPSSSVPA